MTSFDCFHGIRFHWITSSFVVPQSPMGLRVLHGLGYSLVRECRIHGIGGVHLMAPTTVTKSCFSPAAPRSWLSIVQCSLCHFIDMFHWPTMKTRIRVCVALSPFSQKSIKGFNKLWVTQQQWLKRADSGNQPTKESASTAKCTQRVHFKAKGFPFFQRKKPLGCDTDYGELRRWGCCSLV